MEKVLHNLRIEGIAKVGASPCDPAAAALLDFILPTNVFAVDFLDGVVASSPLVATTGLSAPLAVLFFEVDFCGVVAIPSSSKTLSKNVTSFLYTAGLQGAPPVLTAGSRHCDRSLLQAISQHA